MSKETPANIKSKKRTFLVLLGIVCALTFLRPAIKSQAPLSLAQEFALATNDGVTILFSSGPNAGETYVTLGNGKARYNYIDSSPPGEPSNYELPFGAVAKRESYSRSASVFLPET